MEKIKLCAEIFDCLSISNAELQALKGQSNTDRNFVICTFQMTETKFRKGECFSIN
jgi:hypothetical protein